MKTRFHGGKHETLQLWPSLGGQFQLISMPNDQCGHCETWRFYVAASRHEPATCGRMTQAPDRAEETPMGGGRPAMKKELLYGCAWVWNSRP